ncbi:uncharacterized protein LOC132205054 [Neocloeon triangulifer]|uniref:uncharacterized protein LOC132205054 n=1 Tax=Neocloeon triangulifer TaxID=2078957 RepID=UPI00286F56F5|nr:uncharacterized protein LOC132205054 [Neocloeon triangulifer]
MLLGTFKLAILAAALCKVGFAAGPKLYKQSPKNLDIKSYTDSCIFKNLNNLNDGYNVNLRMSAARTTYADNKGKIIQLVLTRYCWDNLVSCQYCPTDKLGECLPGSIKDFESNLYEVVLPIEAKNGLKMMAKIRRYDNGELIEGVGYFGKPKLKKKPEFKSNGSTYYSASKGATGQSDTAKDPVTTQDQEQKSQMFSMSSKPDTITITPRPHPAKGAVVYVVKET